MAAPGLKRDYKKASRNSHRSLARVSRGDALGQCDYLGQQFIGRDRLRPSGPQHLGQPEDGVVVDRDD
jgi:hypothetical protein